MNQKQTTAEATCNKHADHSHKHGDGCGHEVVQHGDHKDYVHDGHYHRVHGDHVDECEGPKA